MAAVNQVAADLSASGIREIMALASRIPEAIRLDIGDPDFATPDHVVKAAQAAMTSGRTHYTPSAGLPELREALAEKVRKRNGYEISSEQVIVTQGASQGLFAALTALTRPGDTVLLPDPAWPNYETMCQLLRVRPVRYALDAETGFVPSAARLASLVTPETRVLLLNSPSNPTGAVIDAVRMRALIDFAEQHDLWVISDECYDEITYDDTFTSAATIRPDRVISAYSFSKTYAMTGWRIGYLAVPEWIANTVAKCQESLLACVSEPTQWAALSALTGPQDQVRRMCDAYWQRTELVLAGLMGTVLHPAKPRGAFYSWLDITATGIPDRDFALRLLDRYGVAVAPGTAFGAAGAGFVRLSLTASDAEIGEGIKRIIAFSQAR